jgi:Predicted DNA binding protein
MPIWEIEITQTDCANVDTTRRFRDTTMLIMNTNVSGEFMGMLSVVFSGDSNELNAALRYLSEHPKICDFSLVSKKGPLAIIYYKMLQTSMFRKSSRTGFRLHPIVIKNGRERWFYLYQSDRPISPDDFNDETTRVLNLKLLTHDDFFVDYPIAFMRINAGRIVSSLKSEEMDLLKKAYDEGFFDWPRKVNLTTLSKRLNTSKSKLSYHFRNIERKVFRLLLE